MQGASAPLRLLVVGGSGMLGSTLLRYFSRQPGIEVHASFRSATRMARLAPFCGPQARLHAGVDVDDLTQLAARVQALRPDVVLNCVGLIKQLESAKDPVQALRVNALLPHELARMATACDARLVHFSTDCVFSGQVGNYVETDFADADDLYGRSKRLGEVSAAPHLTLRTSIIGHEVDRAHSLIDWFRVAASVPGATLRGFRRAIFSGLPTIEIARFVHQHVLPDPALQGLQHLSADPIDKHRLLGLVATTYGIDVQLAPDEMLVIDRSLDSTALRRATGYVPPAWPALVAAMHDDFQTLVTPTAPIPTGALP